MSASILFGGAERKLMKLGFKRAHMDDVTIDYERENERYEAVQQLEIIIKPGGTYVISCQKYYNSDGFSNAWSLSLYEMKLVMKIAKKFQRIHNRRG